MPKSSKPRRNRMGKRARHLDYCERCIYHIIFDKADGIPRFGEIIGDPRIPLGEKGSSICAQNNLGYIIDKSIRNINDAHPLLKTIDAQVMPDHVHFLLFVTDRLSRHVGYEIAALKTRINKRYWEQNPQAKANKQSVFAEDYTDVAIRKEGQLEIEKRYLKQNPQRYQTMRYFPDFFVRDIQIQLESEKFIGFGNPFLLTRGFLFQVWVRSAWSDKEFQRYKARCLDMAAEGGIAVSPFYSKREKEIMREIIEMGGSLIFISMESFGPRSKPQGRQFELCSDGRLLLIYEPAAPDYQPKLKRDIAVRMNRHAKRLAEAGEIHPIFRVTRG